MTSYEEITTVTDYEKMLAELEDYRARQVAEADQEYKATSGKLADVRRVMARLKAEAGVNPDEPAQEQILREAKITGLHAETQRLQRQIQEQIDRRKAVAKNLDKKAAYLQSLIGVEA